MSSPEPATPGADSTTHHQASLRHSLLGPSLLKAGQDRVDQHKVGEIIYNASKGSKFFKHEEKRDEQLTKRIELILERKRHFEALDLSVQERRVDEQILALEAQRDLSQCIVHVDCDAFFASVEELDRPELREVPMAVGGGILTTCNYKAREFGVRSGMAGYIAKQLCPHLVFLPLNFHKYTAKAQEVREVLAQYDERYEAASIDEAFLNITGYLETHKDTTPERVVEQIRKEVLEKTKVSISAGIAPNARLAKIASNINKPNGQFHIPNDRDSILTFMHALPVRKVNGVGRVLERELTALGITTYGEMHPARALLSNLLSPRTWSFLLNCHLGLGRTHIHPVSEYERKSIGTERTFRDLSGAAPLRERLRATARELAADLADAKLAGKTINLKVKLHSFQVLTRQRALHRAIWCEGDLYSHALPLLQELEEEVRPLKVRLMGLRMTQLVSTEKEVEKGVRFFFGTGLVSPGKRKREVGEEGGDEGEWEVWPEDGLSIVGQEAIAEGPGNAAAAPGMSPEGGGSEGANGGGQRQWECPVCTRSLPADDSIFNQHVDFCLSRATIREVVQESSSLSSRGSARKQPDRKRRGVSSAPAPGSMDQYFRRLV